MKSRILRSDFDKATEQPWSTKTCLIAQKVMRETDKKIKSACDSTHIELNDNSRHVLSEGERLLQSFFDNSCWHLNSFSDSILIEAESNLFFLRAFLPLEDKDI